MVASAPSDFTEMVSMGVRLEEAVREGHLTKDEGTKKLSYEFSRKKESEINVVIEERKFRPLRRHHRHQQQVASVTPVVNVSLTAVSYQRPPPQGNQGQGQRREAFDPVPMSYTYLFLTLVHKKLVQTRSTPIIPSPLPWYYKADQTCAFR